MSNQLCFSLFLVLKEITDPLIMMIVPKLFILQQAKYISYAVFTCTFPYTSILSSFCILSEASDGNLKWPSARVKVEKKK